MRRTCSAGRPSLLLLSCCMQGSKEDACTLLGALSSVTTCGVPATLCHLHLLGALVISRTMASPDQSCASCTAKYYAHAGSMQRLDMGAPGRSEAA